jgi:transcriptional regulator with XRE-family HTH domain
MNTPKGEYLRDNGICVGNAISHIRLERGLNLEFVAMELSIDVNVYAMLEGNELAVDDSTLHRLAKIFKVSVMELLALQLSLIEAKDDSASTATIQEQELDLLEQQYQNQLHLLREEARYLRGLLDSLANKS